MTCDDANKVLKEVQNARETLENNIRDVYRQHERAHLFNYFRPTTQFNGDEENHRIRKKVSEKIKEIHNEIHKEVYADKAPLSKPTAKGNGGLRNRSDHVSPRQPLAQLNRKAAIHGDVKHPGLSKTKAKPKKTKVKEVKKSEPPPSSSTAYDDLVYQHIYGRQPHQPHRHTIRHVHNSSFCAPNKPLRDVSPDERKTGPTEIKSKLNDVVVQPTSEYFIHLQSHGSPFSIDRNFPNAIPLLEPSRNLSDRLPISTAAQMESTNDVCVIPSPQPVSSRTPPVHQKRFSRPGPNVAVINMKADDMSESGCERSSAKERIKAKARQRMRSRMKLNIQPLPNVDIDTTDPSTLSSASDITLDPVVTTPQKSEEKSVVGDTSKGYNSFQDFINVQDLPGKTAETTDMEEDEDHEDSFHQPEINLPGCKTPDGPTEQKQTTFPLQNFANTQTNVMDILPIRVPPTLKQNAHDWIEKEVLARLIAQMVDHDQREPVTEFAKQAPTMAPDIEEHNGDWIDGIIGLHGIQLFVDAGVPVNKELIQGLIREVIVERLETMYGYPPRDMIAEVDGDGSVVETVIPTPPQTPFPVSIAADSVATVQTPNQTMSELSEQSINDIVNDPSSDHDEEGLSVPIEACQTPEVSFVEEEEDILNKNINTPDLSLAADNNSQILQNVGTPVSSEVDIDLTQIPITDFELTEKADSPAVDGERLSPRELEVTPPPIVVTKKPPLPALSSLSTPSTTYHSSSTSVGFSTFEGISIGEYMNSNSGLSEGSVGELRLPPKHMKEGEEDEKKEKYREESEEKQPKDFEENSWMENEKPKNRVFVSTVKPTNMESNIGDENLSVGEVNHSSGRELKSIGEVSDQGLLVTDGTGNKHTTKRHAKDPMLQLLDKIDSSRESADEDDYFFTAEPSYRSEGEFIAPARMMKDEKGVVSANSGENIFKSLPQEVQIENKADSYHCNRSADGKDTAHDPDEDTVYNKAQEDSDVPNVLATSSGNVVVVQPQTVNRRIDFSEKRSPPEECDISTNNTYSHIQDISQSEGEVPKSDTVGEVYEELSEVGDLSLEQEKDKVVMVLRLPEVDDDEQNLTDDYDVSHDISTISEL